MGILRCNFCLAALLFVGALTHHCEAQTFLSQNWTAEQRQAYYTTSQGSRIMPYDWFLALEISDSQESFLRDRIPALGYLPNENVVDNPDRLPVGFVLDVDDSGRRHVGLNCAACHTNQIQFGGTTYQIDGAPTLADMWGMLDGIDQALTATRDQTEKFDRFANNVLGDQATDADEVDLLRVELSEFLDYWNQFIFDSRVPHPWGRARLDAFGMIFNRVLALDLGIRENLKKPDAPVSYPFLWGTSFEDRVQWNGSAENTNDVERLGRNVGEVLGVFAQANFRGPGLFEHTTIRTSARRRNQVVLENQLKKLWSPRWPTELGTIDPDKQAAGKALFDQNCQRCHQVIEHGMQHVPVKVKMIPLAEARTDPRMAVNAATGKASTGSLRRLFFKSKMPRGELLQKLVRLSVISPFRDVEQSKRSPLDILPNRKEVFTPQEIADFLNNLGIDKETAIARLEAHHQKLERYYKNLRKVDRWSSKGEIETAIEKESPVLAYKARPLDGIWATAPYLHNGSVPNLYELLLPVDQRSEKFFVGSNEFDPVKVGFSTTQSEGTTLFDTSKPGNSNSGHDTYGEFNEEQRLELVEYMKSL